MRCLFFISVVWTSFLFVGCEKREVDIISGTLYSVATTEGDGFVQFEQTANGLWKGIYYLSLGRLIAEKRTV